MPDGASYLKRQAAEAALDHVRSGMRIGLGTGSTAAFFVRALGARSRDGLDVVGVPTSEATARLAREAGVPLVELDDVDGLDLTVDGADEIGPGLSLIKGGGGALLREKIVAAASRRMIVVADGAKCVDALGRFPLPVEIVEFGQGATRRAVERAAERLGLSGEIALRQSGGATFRSDGGNLIIDAALSRIDDPEALAFALSQIPGVVEHGLFLRLASAAIIATSQGLTEISA